MRVKLYFLSKKFAILDKFNLTISNLYTSVFKEGGYFLGLSIRFSISWLVVKYVITLSID